MSSDMWRPWAFKTAFERYHELLPLFKKHIELETMLDTRRDLANKEREEIFINSTNLQNEILSILQKIIEDK